MSKIWIQVDKPDDVDIPEGEMKVILGDNQERILTVTKVISTGPSSQSDQYPLSGLPYEYKDPTEPVGMEDWEEL